MLKKYKLTKRDVLMAIIFVITTDFFIALYAYISQYPNYYATQYKGEPFYRLFIETIFAPVVYLWDGIICHPELVTASATVAIAVYTYFLNKSTEALANLAENQETSIKRHERAYIVFGALLGVPKLLTPRKVNIRPSAKQYKGSWRMALFNFGRTAGYTVEGEWGICPISEFEQACNLVNGKNKVSGIINGKLLAGYMKEIIRTQDVLGPTGNSPMHYRHMELTERPEKCSVIFGRMIYIDVFRDYHWSTFSYKISEDYSDGIMESLSDDHGDHDPREKDNQTRV